jgi:hypothetical protein
MTLNSDSFDRFACSDINIYKKAVCELISLEFLQVILASQPNLIVMQANTSDLRLQVFEIFIINKTLHQLFPYLDNPDCNLRPPLKLVLIAWIK